VPPRIVVIGGGLVGLCSAVQLARCGASVTVLDAPRAMPSPSWGNAGHLATEQVDTLASWDTIRSVFGRLFSLGGPVAFKVSDLGAWGPWAVRFLRASTAANAARGKQALGALAGGALPAWIRLAETLGDRGLVMDRGHWVVWESAEAAARGRNTWARTDTGTARHAPLPQAERHALESRIQRPLADGLRFENTGQIASPGRALEMLRGHLQGLGGECRARLVSALELGEVRAAVRLADGARLEADQVLVAAGVRSKPLMERVGHRVPLIAERGYHLEGDVEAWGYPTIVFEERAVLVTQFGQRLRATSFVEFGRPDSPPDPKKWRRLRRHVEELGIPFKGPLSEWMGPRPTLPDYLPAMGRSRRVSNLYYAFGHQHLGLTLSALTGELVASLMSGNPPSVALDPFDIERFD